MGKMQVRETGLLGEIRRKSSALSLSKQGPEGGNFS